MFILLSILWACYTFWNCPTVVGYSVLILFKNLFLSFHFYLGSFSLLIFGLLNFSSAMLESSILLRRPSRLFSIHYSVWFLEFTFDSKSCTSLPTLPIWSIIFFPIKSLNILIIANLNFLCINYKVCVISVSGSHACFILSNCIFSFSMPSFFVVERQKWYIRP